MKIKGFDLFYAPSFLKIKGAVLTTLNFSVIRGQRQLFREAISTANSSDKHQHWRGSQAENSLETAPVLVFVICCYWQATLAI